MSNIFARLWRLFGRADKSSKVPHKAENALRIGILGAAKIAPPAVIWPALYSKDVIIIAIAARDGKRAAAYAKKHSIPKWFDSYEKLIEDEEVDAVYIPAPNGLHFKWAVKALQAGKHVLCEKPLTSNADEARQLVEIALKHKRVIMEASHSFHHPALIRCREIVRSGQIGDIVSVTTAFQIPPFAIPNDDIRFNLKGTETRMAGGAVMDAGVYALNCARFLTDLDFATCTSAKAVEQFPGVDKTMEAVITFQESNVVGKISCSLRRPFPWFIKIDALVTGTKGQLYIYNFLMPHVYHYIQVKTRTGEISSSRTEKVYGEHGQSTYEYQLANFVFAVRGQAEGGIAKTPLGGTVDDPVGTMEMIDAIYEKSGLGKRIGYAM